MTVYRPTPVDQEPLTDLVRWTVQEVPVGDSVTRHFVGYCYEGRVSSPVQEWDVETHIGVTRSGRRYRLIGEPGWNTDAMYVWGRWLAINDVDKDAAVDVSSEYSGYEPPPRKPEELSATAKDVFIELDDDF